MTGKLLTEEELKELRAYRITDGLDEEVWGHISTLTEKLRESEAGAAALREALDKFGHTSSCQDDADVGISECCGAGIASCETTAGRDILERLRLAEKELVGRRESEDAQTKAHLTAIKRAEKAESELARAQREQFSRVCDECADMTQDVVRLESERDSALKRAEAAEARESDLKSFCECMEQSVQKNWDLFQTAEARVKELEKDNSGLRQLVSTYNEHTDEALNAESLARAALEKCVEALKCVEVAMTAQGGQGCICHCPVIDGHAGSCKVVSALRAASDAGVGT